jgi:hypothetical protein
VEVKLISLDARAHHGSALIAADDSVWIIVALPWWDIATRLWWWFCPTDKKGLLTMVDAGGTRVRVRAVRIASSHVRCPSLGRKRGSI